MITKRQMGLAMPTALTSGRIDEWYGPLTAAMLRYDITTDTRAAYFLANMAQETGQLQARSENLHYSGDRLIAVFPSLFAGNPDKAYALAAAGPEAIGNYIYADANRPKGYRMGNTQPGDGYKFRGRGPMEITGGNNYRAYFRSVGLPDDSDPDLLLQPVHGALSAAQYWSHAGCNVSADAGDFVGAVVKVNGGTIGLAERQEYLARFVDALAHPDPVVAPPAPVAPAPPLGRPAVVLPVPDDAPPVMADELKPAPALEPVPAMAPVPPPGFSVQPSGNVVIDDIKKSEIVKSSNVGQVVTATAGTVSIAAGAASQLKGLLGTGVSDVAAIVLGVVALAAMGFAFFYFRSIKANRVAMHDKGIA